MKKSSFLLFFLLHVVFFNMVFATAFAIVPGRLLPPKYLSVPQWKSCVSTRKIGSAFFVCLPPVKLKACPVASWQALQKGPLIPYCR